MHRMSTSLNTIRIWLRWLRIITSSTTSRWRFVVSKDANTCLPTWGTAYGMQNYAQYSKSKALREAGGDVMLSIGGANNARWLLPART